MSLRHETGFSCLENRFEGARSLTRQQWRGGDGYVEMDRIYICFFAGAICEGVLRGDKEAMELP